MLQIDFSERAADAHQMLGRHSQFTSNLTLIFIIAALAVWGWQTWMDSLQPKINRITLVADSLQITGSTDICPGEALPFHYALDIDGEGVIVTDDSVDYGATAVLYSGNHRRNVPASGQRIIPGDWPIPVQPDIPINGVLRWKAGNYVRNISIAPANSYITHFVKPVAFAIPFTIRSDCP